MGFYYGAITRKRKKASNPNDQLIITNYKENGKGHEIKEGVGSSFVFWILVVFSSFLSQFKEGCYFLKREEEGKKKKKKRVVGGKLNKITTTTKKKKKNQKKAKKNYTFFLSKLIDFIIEIKHYRSYNIPNAFHLKF